MLTITVGEGGDYHSITEAVEAVSYGTAATILISEGIFREKLFIEKKNIILKGQGLDKTVITWNDGADQIIEDGTRRGTFRSQTIFLGGEHAEVKDLTIRNDAGLGDVVGQALAVYADADEVIMENVRLCSHQDTLFLSPLPQKERMPGGFFGPRMMAPRKNTRQHYKNCVIEGDVDFIFGGADAVFDGCRIVVCDRKKEINGYVTAPSENLGDLGFLFRNCMICGENDEMEGTVFLGRPWRPVGRATFISCIFDRSVSPLRFSEWKEPVCDESEAHFAEYGSQDISGNDADLSHRNIWVNVLEDDEAERINILADGLIEELSRRGDDLDADRDKSS